MPEVSAIFGTGAAQPRWPWGRSETEELFMADPREPDRRPGMNQGMHDPQYHRTGTSQGMPGWSWAAIAAAVLVVLGLVFFWPDTTQQQAETPMNPGTGTTSTTPPAKSPAAPTPGTTTPPANQSTPTTKQ
jgi:hypothetical protein